MEQKKQRIKEYCPYFLSKCFPVSLIILCKNWRAILYFRKHTFLILFDIFFFIWVDCIKELIFWFHFISYLYLYFILQNWVLNCCWGKTCSLAYFVALFFLPETWRAKVVKGEYEEIRSDKWHVPRYPT